MAREVTDVRAYSASVHRLSEGDGGGFLAEIPDLPGLMADGETIGEAVEDAYAAAEEWIAARMEEDREVPAPSLIGDFSGKWVQRVPKTLHWKLTEKAKREGVSLNQLVTFLIAHGLGQKEAGRAR